MRAPFRGKKVTELEKGTRGASAADGNRILLAVLFVDAKCEETTLSAIRVSCKGSLLRNVLRDCFSAGTSQVPDWR